MSVDGMLTTCSEPGCATLVLGGYCVEHERRPVGTYVRGRPHPPAARGNRATAYGASVLVKSKATTAVVGHATPAGVERSPS
jgi:hypothetical protein